MPVSSKGSRIGQGEKLNCDAVATDASANQKLWNWNVPAGLSQLRQGGQDFVSPTLTSRGVGVNLDETTSFRQVQFLCRVLTISIRGKHFWHLSALVPRAIWVMHQSSFSRSFTAHFVGKHYHTLKMAEQGVK